MPNRPPSHADAFPRATTPAAGVDRLSARQRGYTWAWQKYRLRFLAAHPLCARCVELGTWIQPATIVDHRIPHKGNPSLFWNPDNHQGLCATHHNEKTAREDGGFGNKRRV